MPTCLVLGYHKTDSARLALRWAVKQLLPEGKLVIVHSCRPLHASPRALWSAEERQRLGRALVDKLLLEGEESLFDLDVEVEVLDSDPVSALRDAAVRHGAEAIVVGSEHHSRLLRAIGTVTADLLAESPVPVVVVPQTASVTAA
jgi:nucleotide-binding universal stress UspA family protein